MEFFNAHCTSVWRAQYVIDMCYTLMD